MDKTINDFLREYEEGQLDYTLTPRERTLNTIITYFDGNTNWTFSQCKARAEVLVEKLEQAGVLR